MFAYFSHVTSNQWAFVLAAVAIVFSIGRPLVAPVARAVANGCVALREWLPVAWRAPATAVMTNAVTTLQTHEGEIVSLAPDPLQDIARYAIDQIADSVPAALHASIVADLSAKLAASSPGPVVAPSIPVPVSPVSAVPVSAVPFSPVATVPAPT